MNRAIIIFFTSWKVFLNIFYGYQLYQKCQSSVYGFSILLKFEIYVFVSTAILKIKKGSGNTSPPSRFVHLPGVQNLSLRPPTEVKFFTPCHFWNFQKFLMSRKIQIDESVIFVSVICHRWCSDTNSRIIFFLCTFSNFLLWDFLMTWHRRITFSPSSINQSILQLLRYGFFEFFEYVIVVKQYVLAYAYHTIQ